ncbi:MAG: NVEALA domain-containing protein [Clostridium sp.]|nr:NVEALA domain-containing protein [Clostridium sp.]
MRKKILFDLIAIAFIAFAFGCLMLTRTNQYEELSGIQLENVEALAEEEDDDCNYKNGYLAFTNKSGGAYDCCKNWVSKAPNTNEGRCH